MNATEDHDGEIPDGIQLTPFDEDFRQDPYATYRRLRARDPVHRDKLSFYENSWTITDYQRVRELLRDSRLSADSRRVGIVRDPRVDNPVTRAEPDMMTLDDPDHRRLKGLVEKAFTRRQAEAFRPRIDQVAMQLCDALASHGEFDVVAQYAKLLPTIVIAEFIGVDSDDHEDFKRWTDTLLMRGYPQPTEDQWSAIVQADAALSSYVETTIQERRARPCDDLISRLIAARENDDQLSEDEMVRMCTLLIGAGNFTTTDLIANAILALIQHPAQQAKRKPRADRQRNRRGTSLRRALPGGAAVRTGRRNRRRPGHTRGKCSQPGTRISKP